MFIRIAGNDIAAVVDIVRQADGKSLIIVSDIESAGNGIESLAINSQGIPHNAATALGSDRHRYGVAEDEVHVAVEGEGVVVGDVGVRHIPACIERCFAAREQGEAVARVHQAVSVNVIDDARNNFKNWLNGHIFI